MPEFQLPSANKTQTIGGVPASSSATVLTGSSSANTLGSIVELTAATDFAANEIMVSLQNPSAVRENYRVDILLGAASSEVVLVPGIPFYSTSGINYVAQRYRLPMHIPAGSRVSARCSSATGGSDTVEIAATLFQHGLLGLAGSAIAEGYDGGSVTGVGALVEPGATPNTDSAWVELTASTVRDHHAWVLHFAGVDSTWGGSGATLHFMADIATGPGGSEVVVVEDMPFVGNTTTDAPSPQTFEFPLFVPAGTRIAVRARSSHNNADDTRLSCCLLGM